MRQELIISGSGGQGVMTAGTLLCYAGMAEGKNVTFFPSYGAEMRGGTANCQVIISDDIIGSPVVTRPDILLSFNKPSYERFSVKMKKGGMVFANTSLFKPEKRRNIKIIEVPANELAEKYGSMLVMNMTMVGAYISGTGAIEMGTVMKTLDDFLVKKKKAMLVINKQALIAGYNYHRKKNDVNSDK